MNKLIKIVILLFMPVIAFSQTRSVVMILQLKTSEKITPTLFYMIHDSVIYDLGKGKDGIYEECLPGNMVTNDAAFAIQVEGKWNKIVSLGELETQGYCDNGTITLTLLEIKRFFQGDPEDTREYKTPPKPYHRTLLNKDTLSCTNTNRDLYQLLLIATSARDSLYCSAFLPQQALDGTYYTVDSIIAYPKASCIDKTKESLQLEVCEYYLQCGDEESIKSAINDLTFIVDEKGMIRGVFCFVEKNKQVYGKNIVTKVFYHFKDERFHPAEDWITKEPVPDLINFCGCFSR